VKTTPPYLAKASPQERFVEVHCSPKPACLLEAIDPGHMIVSGIRHGSIVIDGTIDSTS
jgi:hypothetical protein